MHSCTLCRDPALCRHTLFIPHWGCWDGSLVKKGGGDVVNDMVSAVGAGVVGTLVLANNTKPITTDTSLLTPYLSSNLTFLLFWESKVCE